jgi:hypothetical protein
MNIRFHYSRHCVDSSHRPVRDVAEMRCRDPRRAESQADPLRRAAMNAGRCVRRTLALVSALGLLGRAPRSDGGSHVRFLTYTPGRTQPAIHLGTARVRVDRAWRNQLGARDQDPSRSAHCVGSGRCDAPRHRHRSGRAGGGRPLRPRGAAARARATRRGGLPVGKPFNSLYRPKILIERWRRNKTMRPPTLTGRSSVPEVSDHGVRLSPSVSGCCLMWLCLGDARTFENGA